MEFGNHLRVTALQLNVMVKLKFKTITIFSNLICCVCIFLVKQHNASTKAHIMRHRLACNANNHERVCIPRRRTVHPRPLPPEHPSPMCATSNTPLESRTHRIKDIRTSHGELVNQPDGAVGPSCTARPRHHVRMLAAPRRHLPIRVVGYAAALQLKHPSPPQAKAM